MLKKLATREDSKHQEQLGFVRENLRLEMGQQQSKDELLYQQVSYGNTEGIKSLCRDGAGLEVKRKLDTSLELIVFRGKVRKNLCIFMAIVEFFTT